jgi:CHAP domain
MSKLHNHRLTRKFAAAVLSLSAVASAGAVVLGLAQPAWASVPTGPLGSQFCTDYGEGSNGSYANVYACNGPSRGNISFKTASGTTVTTDTVGFQCVELADRYLYAEKGWSPEFTNGADIVRVYGQAHGIAPIVSGNTSGQTPKPGDVISFSVLSNFTDDGGYYPGHVALVVAQTPTSITILSENWGGQSAKSTLGLSGTRVSSIQTENGSGAFVNTPYIEWMPITASSTPPPPSYGPYAVVGTGSNGLNERSQPSTSATTVGDLANGTVVYLSCQTAGTAYSTGGTPSTDSIWDRLTNGAYVADYWLSTPAVGTFSPGIPRC